MIGKGWERDLFGYVKPNIPELKVREKQRYEAWYCGLCRSLGKRYGLLPRLTLSYDGAFLAMLVSAASGFESPCGMHTCPTRPLAKKKPMVCGENPALDYAADICVILAEYKLRDDVRDGKPLRAAAALPLKRAFRRAKKLEPGVHALVGERIRELNAIEAKRERSLDLAANCFGELMRGVMEAAPVRGENENARVMSEFGFWLGRVIYLLDAWDDREKDAKRGLYNPFLLMEATREEAEQAVNFSINSAISAYNLLEARHPDLRIVENILHEGFFAAFDGAAARAEQTKAKKAITERTDKKN